MNEVLMLMLTICILDRSVLRESLNNTEPLCLASDSYPWINCKEKANISDLSNVGRKSMGWEIEEELITKQFNEKCEWNYQFQI